MRQLLLCFCLLAACSSSSPAESPASNPAPDAGPEQQPPIVEPEPENALAEAVDALLTSGLAADTFTGAAIVVDGGKVVLEKGYGAADRESGAPNARATVFRIGSLSKQFTAAAILALADEGKLAVSDPVSKHVPEYPIENLTKDGVELTLHHLLAQASGAPNAFATKYFQENAWLRPIEPPKLLEATMITPLAFTPGTKHAYENFNYFLLGLVVERVSGKSYDVFLRERLLVPAGLAETGAILPAGLASRAAVGYADGAAGPYAFSRLPGFGDPDVTAAFGAGQLYSTVEDLAKWDRALAAGTVLTSTSRALLFKANLAKYAYGWVADEKAGVAYQWHNGAISPLGFSSFMIRVPSKDRFVAYLANLDTKLTSNLQPKLAALATK